ncbi:hypothetical protein E1287_38650 [Actinomadura sp. KC06]|uniref:hypothetical protein n=1 Tax=Actinomadura sp. KC06 TaxID=2530369 RepID=UPI00104DB2EC|nr:hypothetical protein [Actinomadura sp. KC06]TDD23810.1 hypothetical protein E1287_38650 [Actinomadura sp. KC06]
MNVKRVLIGVVIAGLVLVGISLNSSRRSSEPGGLTTRSPASASLSPSGTPSASAATNALRLLPFTREQLSDAVQLATRFTAAYASYRFDEDPQTYLDRLNPMMSTQLQPVIARAATHPGTLDRRRRDHEVTVAHARPEAIRALGPTSITVLLTTTAKITNRHSDRQDTTRYAVTVTDHDGTWQVYAIELASTGNTGQSVTNGDPP